MTVFFNKNDIVQTEQPTTAAAAIAAIDAIILQLLGAQARILANPNYDPSKDEYRLDDGQTTVSVRYKNEEAIQNSIFGWIRLKTYYQNALNGRVVRLCDVRNFPNRRFR